MNFHRIVRLAGLATCLCLAPLLPASALAAPAFLGFLDPNPATGNGFGSAVVALSTGNVVITSPGDDFNGLDAGAAYLFNGATGALITALRGSTAGDRIGSAGVIKVGSGNYVILSPHWHNGPAPDAGAATWGSGTAGVSGVVAGANSLVGSNANDQVGSSATVLTNGNYVVASPLWRNGGIANAGAATLCSGGTGTSGLVSPANSLVGSFADDYVGSALTALSNGNYVVRSIFWNAYRGAATWGNGLSGVTGAISSANSLVGSAAYDQVGGNVSALANGNYVVASPQWDNGANVDAGAVTWGSGASGVTGVVSVANSLVGSTAYDYVGSDGVSALTNGNYVVASAQWDNGAITQAGAATWGNGATGITGAITAGNSLVGTTANDFVSSYGVAVLSNGNYVVSSASWNNGAVVDAGAATWGSGTIGVSGAVSAANSLVGSTTNDVVGVGVVPLTNGHYVVRSPSWSNGAIAGAGAVTRGSGTAGITGAVSVANSLVGSTANDNVGISVTALSNGNYVVGSPNWNNGAAAYAGATTWGSGTTGLTGVVSVANSLIGSTAYDEVGNLVTPLTNGNYVVCSAFWSNFRGAATWGNGNTGIAGLVSVTNSLVGGATNDYVGGYGITVLTNGNYLVRSAGWGNGKGAVTWGSGGAGITGVASTLNSLVGATVNDYVGGPDPTALSDGNYVVNSSSWQNGGLLNAGAATWGNGTGGINGFVSSGNSLVGTTANTNMGLAIEDVVNGNFISRFPTEDGGRVRIGPQAPAPYVSSAVDIPSDQGGWLRLTLLRSSLDFATASPAVSFYGVWRHVPGTLATEAHEIPSEPRLGTRVTVLDPPSPEITASFPPGTWELVASVPAVQQSQYVVAVPTISNAAANEFVATAHTTTPSIWFIGNAVSAQSIDNLAPAPPTQLTAVFQGGQTNLQWAQNTENDLGSYSLYRGTSAGFTPSIGNRIASQNATHYSDPGPAGSYYKLSAVDVNGNESGFALVTPGQTVGVDPVSERVAFALEGVRPNPARSGDLRVTFVLPSASSALLELVDVGGRRVLAHDVGSLGPGRHSINLAEGRGVAAGIYWVRLTQGRSEQKARAAVIQ